MGANIKKLVPRSIKRPVKEMLLRRQLRHAIKTIGRLPVGEGPNRRQLTELITGWSNEGFVANLEYLEAVADHSLKSKGPVLECGSGVTTILMGILCGKRNIDVWSLEHYDEWRQRVSGVLSDNKIAGVHVCSAPLVEYGEFVWYDPPMAQMPEAFSLVICDGPPGSTKGGRYGLLPVLGDRLPAGAMILLDDAGRPGEAELIKRWENEARFETEIRGSQEHRFAMMRRLS
ncbi:MAG TPA: hypothetical protein VE980_23365 [Pyrinomonadaceae bacterium]|nr:hypothetical protein [Pyrinomonadaceae bacterium]